MSSRLQIKNKMAEVKAQLIAEGWKERDAERATVRPWESKSNHKAIKELAAMVDAASTKVVLPKSSPYITADLPDFDRDTSVNGVE
jgi:hypothetical protein